MADPGFPVGGGVDLVGGAVDPRGGYVSKILHVKMKESGPVGGARAGRAPPRSANASDSYCSTGQFMKKVLLEYMGVCTDTNNDISKNCSNC